MVKIELDMNMKLPMEREKEYSKLLSPQLKIPFEKNSGNIEEEVLFDEDMNDVSDNLDEELERKLEDSMGMNEEVDNLDENMEIKLDDSLDMNDVSDNLDEELERKIGDSMGMNEDLAKRDKKLLKIEEEIELRRKFLLEKQKRLDKLTRQNHFLETIKKDYETYHNYIVEQKESQIRAMNSIKQYVEDLIVSGKLTDEDIRQAKDDQREITGEVKKIREKINEIIGV
jgi:hypothetical protein